MNAKFLNYVDLIFFLQVFGVINESLIISLGARGSYCNGDHLPVIKTF